MDNEMWDISTMDYYSTIQNNEIFRLMQRAKTNITLNLICGY